MWFPPLDDRRVPRAAYTGLSRALADHPDEPWYGVSFDTSPVAPWDEKLITAAGKHNVAIAVSSANRPSAFVIGGDLARAVGSLIPVPVNDRCALAVWSRIGEDFGLVRRVEAAVPDAPEYVASAADQEIFDSWLESQDRLALNERIAAMLGIGVSMFDLSKVRLSICLPLHDFRIDMALDDSLRRSLQFCAQHGMSWRRHIVAGGSNAGKARERLLYDALATDSTHFMFVDYDMGWDGERLIGHLLAADHDFVAVMGVKKSEELGFCGNFFLGAQTFHERTKFLKVKDVGFGLVILKRIVIERMRESYPELEYDNDDGRLEHALFLETIVKDPETGKRTRLSEDLSFCRRWTAIGGEIWVDHQVALQHYGRIGYTGRVADIFKRGADAPTKAATGTNEAEAA